MNKHTLSIVLLAGATLGIHACKKDNTATATAETTASQTITARVAKSTPYSYNLAASTSTSTSYRIVDPSDVGAGTSVNTVQNVPVFEYVPATDFIGEDLVQVVAITDSSSNTGCGSGRGGRGAGGGTRHTDTLTFQVQVTETGS